MKKEEKQMSDSKKESNAKETSQQPKPPEITLNKPLYESFSKDTSCTEKRKNNK